MADKYYNVWRSDRGTNRWVKELYEVKPSTQDPNDPQKLSYTVARKCLEYWRAAFPRTEVWVREIADDGISPGIIVGFNVYMVALNRWTNVDLYYADNTRHRAQDPSYPAPLSYTQAIEFRNYIGEGEVKEIDSDLSPQPIFKIPVNVGASSIAPAVPSSTPTVIPAPTQPVIDFDAYNGFLGLPKWMISMAPTALERAARDPYTGLAKKKE